MSASGHHKASSWSRLLTGLTGVFCHYPLIAALVVFGLATFLPSTPSHANSYFHAKTHQHCKFCHAHGEENEGKLNSTGRAFQRAFDECASCALRRYSVGNRPESRETHSRNSGRCSSKFRCNAGEGRCTLRIFSDAETRTIRMSPDTVQRVHGLHRGDEFCFIRSGHCTRPRSKPKLDCD